MYGSYLKRAIILQENLKKALIVFRRAAMLYSVYQKGKFRHFLSEGDGNYEKENEEGMESVAGCFVGACARV